MVLSDPAGREPAHKRGGLRFVFKFPFDPATGGQFNIPEGSQFLDLQVQDGVPTMWWSVPKSGEHKLRTFSVVPTGMPGYTENIGYVGTFQLEGFVGHLFAWEDFDRA